MKLVEADAEGPPGEEDAVARPTPPRPERRRVVVSLGFTVAVLVGTVFTIYAVFPARHNYLVTAALEEHRRDAPWQLEAPAPAELRAWTLGFLDLAAPLPEASADIVAVGARRVELLNRPAAVVRYRIEGGEVTMVVQRARDLAARRVSRVDGRDRVVSWRRGAWSVAAVGPEVSAEVWTARVGAP